MQLAHILPGPIAAALLACLMATGCAPSPLAVLTIHDSPRGSVYLERIQPGSFQATHPITLETGVIARALRGIQVRDDRNTLQAFLGSRPEAVRAFSDQEADFLAPLISTALAKASPDQRIGFRVGQTTRPPESRNEGPGPGPSEPSRTLAPGDITSGVLFAYGRSLQIQLTRFRSGSQKRSMMDGPNRHYVDQTGLTGRKLEFLPEEAQRPDTFRVGEAEFPTLVIDYDALAGMQDRPASPSSIQPAAAGPDQPAPATAQEVEALRKELREIKEQLREQQSGKPRSKATGNPDPAR